MSDWPGNDGEMTSLSNFKLRFSKRPLDLVRDFLFQFGLISEVWLPWVRIWVKIGHCKARNVRLAGNDGKMTRHSNFKLRFSERSLDLGRGFYELCMNFMRFDKCGFHGYSSDWKLDIVKQGMSDWPGNDGKMTSRSYFKVRFSERLLDLVRVFCFNLV